ncbi:MAG: Xaa-Pro peptidase family protein [Chloroflexi bacterium]|nr:Xaa-Pro peptidase family protein [Chloroflexota bacterium]
MPIAADSPYTLRQQRLQAALAQADLGAVLLNPGPTLVYFTGLHFHLSERPVLFILPQHGDPCLALPELETQKVASLPYALNAYPYGEDPSHWNAAFQAAFHAAGLSGLCRLGVEPRQLRYLEMQCAQAAAPQALLADADALLAAPRACKDASEIAAIRKAVEIAQTALTSALPLFKIGMTEQEFASEMVVHLLRAGGDPTLPFSPIVSAGPNSANPHASPSARAILPGDLLVVDWGAFYQGYCSDLTRTFAIGQVEPQLTAIAQIVLQANQAGRAAAAPGLPASRVDAAARAVIEQAGYGAFFTHRTGHGIGLDPHEPPYMRGDNAALLEPGMVFTVEPGIYLPGRNGVRIEDNVVITPAGAETLSSLPRELAILE